MSGGRCSAVVEEEGGSGVRWTGWTPLCEEQK